MYQFNPTLQVSAFWADPAVAKSAFLENAAGSTLSPLTRAINCHAPKPPPWILKGCSGEGGDKRLFFSPVRYQEALISQAELSKNALVVLGAVALVS